MTVADNTRPPYAVSGGAFRRGPGKKSAPIFTEVKYSSNF